MKRYFAVLIAVLAVVLSLVPAVQAQNPFLDVIRAQWIPEAQSTVERLNIRAVKDYQVKQSNWVINWKSYGSETWFEERYPYPVPDGLWVVGIVDLVDGDHVYKVPGPVQTADPVCTPIPRPQRETAPTGIVAEFSSPVEPGNPFGMWRAGRWTTAPDGYTRTVVIKPDGTIGDPAVDAGVRMTFQLRIVQGPIGRHIWWEPK